MKDKIEVKIDWFFTPLMIAYIAISVFVMSGYMARIATSLEKIEAVVTQQK